VKLTGFARYDSLKDRGRKTIAIMPTWRKSIAPPTIKGTSRRVYSSTFRESEYCRFYNALINDSRILEAMKNNGYSGCFYIHPSHSEQAKDFSGNEIISVWNGPVQYNKVFCESALLITDYSSVAMDFAYLKKPVIYTQFDKEEFFQSHSYEEGYFDYERDGFGVVCFNYEDTINAIVDCINNRCEESSYYIKRIEEFFAFTDDNNCKRIVKEIEKL
jgi:CDP-glycerol glycerophosphotransferase (TagB/SpsB family)